MKTNVASDSETIAVATALKALAGTLRRCSKCSAEACKLSNRGELDGAIGTIAGIDGVLSEAIALYRAALALHCIRRRTGPTTGDRRASAGKRQRNA